MIRLHVIAEGQTEETFVHQVLVSHLVPFNVFIDVHCVTTNRRRGRLHRGGLPSYAKARRDISLWTRQDRNADARFTTFFDLYGLPNDFPGYAETRNIRDPYEKVAILEQAMAADVSDRRFVPYIQLHEFESLVLVSPRHLEDAFPEHERAIQNLEALTAEYASPELIDEGEHTAPSKRIIQELPIYAGAKRSAGPLVAARIGLDALRRRCPHFGSWLDQLEALAGNPE